MLPEDGDVPLGGTEGMRDVLLKTCRTTSKMNLQVTTKEQTPDFFAVPAGGNGSRDAAALERLVSSVVS